MRTFYERDEQERIDLTKRAIRDKKTLMERWSVLTPDESNAWSQRSKLAAEWLHGSETVLDLGCGNMQLEQYLTCAYIPSDVSRRDARTIVRDYNIDGAPNVDIDAAAVLGLLEYLYDPCAFLEGIRSNVLVASYCTTDAPAPLEPRRGHAWVNDYDKRQIEQIFSDAGWVVEACKFVNDAQLLWRLKRRLPLGAG